MSQAQMIIFLKVDRIWNDLSKVAHPTQRPRSEPKTTQSFRGLYWVQTPGFTLLFTTGFVA